MAGPYADIREYLVVHQSLRVTLGRFVDASDRLEPARLAEVVGERWGVLARGLHHHHEVEDTKFFPMIMASRPDTKALIEQLEAEHRELVAKLDAVDAAISALERDPTNETRQAVRDAIATVRDFLVPHLDIEDAQLLTVAAESVPAEPWKRVSEEAMRSLPRADLPVVAGILDEIVHTLPKDQWPPPPPLPVRVMLAVSWRRRYQTFVAPLVS